MIVRIMADNQYRIDDGQVATREEIDRLDGELFQALAANDDTRFHEILARLINRVHESGTAVPLEELIASDIIVPAEDMTTAETRANLQLATVS